MGAPPVPEMTPAVLIRDSRGADSQYLAVLMRANTHVWTEVPEGAHADDLMQLKNLLLTWMKGE